MNQQLFKNSEFGELEVFEENNIIYFPATHSAEILGYKNPEWAIHAHCKGVREIRTMVQTGVKKDGSQALRETKINFIPESDLYRLIAHSKLPSAERFECWIFEEVLPTIRRHGIYASNEILNNPDLLIKLANAIKDERAKNVALTEKVTAKEYQIAQQSEQIATQSEQIAEMKPKASYCDIILDCPGVVPVTIIAKDYGKSAVWLNDYLHKLGIQYKIGETWVLYADYVKNGYTHTQTSKHINPKTGRSFAAVQTRWTQAGRRFIYDVLKSNGILPTIEQS